MRTVQSLHIKTPLVDSYSLSKRTGKEVYLKLENLQPCGSFKIRGIGRVCQDLKTKGFSHFVSSSAGNAGYATAYAGLKLGIETTVFAPESVKPEVIKMIKDLQANVHISGRDWDDAHKMALEFTEENNFAYIHPFDNQMIWNGHSTLIDEAAKSIDQPDAILLSVGGGGLLSGVAEGLTKNGWADSKLITAETEGAHSLFNSVQHNEITELKEVTSIAKTLGARRVCDRAFEVTNQFNFQPIVVSDEQALASCSQFAYDHRFLVEPSCGAALAPLYFNFPELSEVETILVIVCGGISITGMDNQLGVPELNQEQPPMGNNNKLS